MRKIGNFVSTAILLLISSIIDSNSAIFEGPVERHNALLIYNL
jgi:hypothetical protein